MKMKKLNKQVLAITAVVASIILSAILPASVNAQSNYKLLPAKDVSVKVLGSSNIHDWTMNATSVDSQGDFKIEGGQLRGLSSFSFSADAKGLKSEHTSMDDRTYKCIKADQFSKITFKLTSAVVTEIQKDKYAIKALGDLTISGATQAITLNVTAVVNADNTINCTGSQKIKLTDYKIDPPSFMLGAMKVANDLTIQFNLIYKNSQLLTKAI
jgi:polyisoprenoid-binding protein YceI